MALGSTLVESVDNLLQDCYPEFLTTSEVVFVLEEDRIKVYRALCRLERAGLAVRYKVAGNASVAWSMRSVVGT